MTAEGNEQAPWARTLSLEVADQFVELSFGPGHEGLAQEIAELWSHLVVTNAPTPGGAQLAYVAGEGATPRGATVLAPHPAATYTISGHVTRSVIRGLIGSRLLLHAGVVETPQHGVVVVVGASGAGKSTATVHLGRAGTYLSDELTIIDPTSFVVTGYPKPVSRAITGSVTKHDVRLPELRLLPGSVGRAPAMIVLLDRARGESTLHDEPATLVRVPLAEALLHLIAQSSSLWQVPGGLAALAMLVETTGGALRAQYREASELPELLLQVPDAVIEDWEAIPAPESALSPAPGMLLTAPYMQALALESGVIVLTRHEATFLEGLSGLVWDLVRAHGELDLGTLEMQLTETIGAHPESSILVRSTVNRLISGGWVLRG